MIKKISPAILVGLFSIIPLMFWYSLNQTYPNIDAADYLKPVMHGYLDFDNYGWWAGLQSFFTTRIWKPIFFPLLALPALILTGNRIAPTVAITMMAIHFLMGCYVFLHLNRYHSKLWSAGLAVLIMSIPLMINNGNKFNTESAFAFFVLATFYHGEEIVKAWDTKSITATLAWTTLATLIRPVEAVVILGPGVLIVLGLAWRKKILSTWFMLLTALIIGCEIVLLGLVFLKQAIYYPYFYRLCCFLPLILVALGLKEYYWDKRNPLSLLIGVSFSILALWYVPYAGALIHWVYECTFGEMAARTGGRKDGDWIPYLCAIFRDLSGNLMVLMALCTLILNGPRLFLRLPWIWLLAILPTFAIGFMSHNSLSRYYSAPALLILCLMGFYITQPKTTWKRLLVYPLLAFGFLLNLQGINGGLRQESRMEPFWYKFFVSIVEPAGKYNDYMSYYQQMKKFIGDDKAIRHTSVMMMKTQENDNGRQMPDPWSLGIISHQDGSYNDFFIGYTDPSKSADDQLLDLHCFAEYVIVGPLDGKPDMVWNGGSMLGLKILEAWKSNKLEEMNFDKVGLMKSTFDRGSEMKFLMLKTKPEFYGCQNRLSSRYKKLMFN